MSALLKSLDERVIAALTTASSSGSLTALAAEVAAERRALEVTATKAKAESLNPLVSDDKAAAARQRYEASSLQLERLVAQETGLIDALASAEDEEAGAARAAEREAALKERDDLAAEVRTRYPALAAELADLAGRLVANNGRVIAATATDRKAPELAEALGRGFATHELDSVQRITQLSLPGVGRHDAPIWPPRQLSGMA